MIGRVGFSTLYSWMCMNLLLNGYFQNSRIPEICKSGNIYLEKSLLHRISMPSCVGLNPSARKVMRFLEVGSRCPPEASHGRQQRFLIPEDSRNIAAENPPVIFRFGDAFSGEELSSANAGAVPVA